MDYETKIGIIVAFLPLSLVFSIVIPLLLLLYAYRSKKNLTETPFKINWLLAYPACLLASVWLLRYAVGWYGILHATPKESSLNVFEEIFNSLVHALQTFSMDEDYTTYILDGKAMLREVLGENALWQEVYGGYAALMNFVAPVAGGAIVLDILASIFPNLQLNRTYLCKKREKLYFSQLDETTLVLAKSVYREEVSRGENPVIIFTNVDSDGDGDLLSAAKQLGAICVKDDLTHVKKNKKGHRRFFLMNENETENLRVIASLVDNESVEYLNSTEICYFTAGDAYVQVEKSIRDRLTDVHNFADDEGPVFIPIRSYRNLVTNLLTEVPLYEPLVGKQKNPDGTQDLNVTILGSGFIGTQMFLSTYWFGQLLNCNLKIQVISQETEEEFWSKIDYVNPEIRHTTQENDPILQINRMGDMAPVYATVTYTQCDARSSAFLSKLTDPRDGILKTDYFFVALGTDDENISVANTVRKYVGQHRATTTKRVKAVIAYVVYDTELSKALNVKMRHSFTDKETKETKETKEADVYMRAVGSLAELYSAKNVFMTRFESFAQKTNENYHSAQSREDVAEAHRKRMQDDYKHWANLARSMHIIYKLYSMGLVDYSIFDADYTPESYDTKQAEAYAAYKTLACNEYPDPEGNVDDNGNPIIIKDVFPFHEMAWLEHRRWNAFTRVMGFRHPSTYEIYAPNLGDYKHMDLKLHPCLVECDKVGMRAPINEKGAIGKSALFAAMDCTDFDLLDDLSYALSKDKDEDKKCDFKIYDYPAFDPKI